MPIYEYECNSCGEKFELYESMHDAGKKAKCIKCGDTRLRRVVSVFMNNTSPDSSCGPAQPT